MTKSKWFESTKKRSIVIFLCVFLIAAVGFCVKTGLTGGADKDIKIQTEYCDLYYPARWGKNIKILQTENDVQFRAEIEGYGLQPLFDIHFNSDAGTFCGVILTEDGAEVTVSQTTYPIEPKEEWPWEQLDMVRQMQAELTGILSQMPLTMPEPADAQAVQEATGSTGV